ncbi:MAG: flavodoxin family protein, partial [Peptococcaceae bacterium]
MRVFALNGSTHEHGVTYHALQIVGDTLQQEGIDMEIMHLDGRKHCKSCMSCNACRKNDNLCIDEDAVNDVILNMRACDGFILAAPAHAVGVPGHMKTVMDKLQQATQQQRGYTHKPAATLAICRRSGALTTLQQLNNYLATSNMIRVGSLGWTISYGLRPEDILQDKEGIQALQQLGKNMAWILKVL